MWSFQGGSRIQLGIGPYRCAPRAILRDLASDTALEGTYRHMYLSRHRILSKGRTNREYGLQPSHTRSMQAWLTNAAHGYWQSDWIHLLSLSDSSFGAKQGKRRGTRVLPASSIGTAAGSFHLELSRLSTRPDARSSRESVPTVDPSSCEQGVSTHTFQCENRVTTSSNGFRMVASEAYERQTKCSPRTKATTI